MLLLLICAPLGNAASASKTFLLLGDSLSAAHNIPVDAGWPTLLQARLTQMRPGYRLVNASISGATTADGLSRLPGLLKQYHPAVVMLDLKLPKVDGLEVLKAVRETPELRSLPVVMLTSSHEEGDVVKSYALGVNAYVVKPVEFKAFVTAIADLGIFWAVLNEPPPGSTKAARRVGRPA